MKTQIKISLLALVLLSIFNAQFSTAFAQDGTWTTAASLPQAAWSLGTVVGTNGWLYAAGGAVSACGRTAAVFAYNPATNGWSTETSMPAAITAFALANFNGTLYTIGGESGCAIYTHAQEVSAYNIASNSWASMNPFPFSIMNENAAVANGTLYVLGGSDPAVNIWTNSVFAYDPTNDSWSLVSLMPGVKAWPEVTVANNIIYVMGGSVPNYGMTNTVWSFNPATGIWATNASMPIPLYNGSADTLNGTIYVTAGISTNNYFSAVEAYNPQSDTWTIVTPLPTGTFGAGVTALNGKLYVVGGTQNESSSTLSTVQVFTPTNTSILTNIVVTPANSIIAAGSNEQFTATEQFSDGSFQTLTNGGESSFWSSSNPAIASIDTNGVALGLTNGTTTITATSGSVSGNTTLTVVVPPSISMQPTNNTVPPNGSVTFGVSATGGDLTYQWQLNGTNIAGATGATLTVPDVTSTNVGVYTVIVSNAAGVVTSSSAMLASVDIKMFAGVVVNGPLGSNYLIQATSNLLTNWTTLTNVALPTQPYIYIDYNSPTSPQQFYRAVPQ